MPNFMQETRKNYSAVLAAEPERTHGREFIGSFRSLTPGNQKSLESILGQNLKEMEFSGQKLQFFCRFFAKKGPILNFGQKNKTDNFLHL